MAEDYVLDNALNNQEIGNESRSHMPSVLEADAARVGDDSLSLSLGSGGGYWRASTD